MESVNKDIEALLLYGERELDLSPAGKAFARNRLLELLQTEPSEEEASQEKPDIDAVLSRLTSYAVENGIVEEEVADKFPDLLMNVVMPSQDDAAHTYSRLHRDGGRAAAEKYFSYLAKASRYVKKPKPGTVGWNVVGRNGDFTVMVPSEDREETESGYYPKCPYCLENLGFCGLPGQPAQYAKRVLPFDLDGETWYFYYRQKQLVADEFIAAAEKHRPSGEGRVAAALADLAEKVPAGFAGTTFEPKEHDYLFGAKRALPIFTRPVKRVLFDGDYKVSILDWNFSVLRIEGYIKKDLVRVASKVMKYWRNYSEGNIVYPIFHCTETSYIADIALLKRGKANVLFDKPDYYGAFGLFVLPHKMKEDILAMVAALGEKKIDFQGVHDSPTIGKYLEWIIQIAASRGAELPKEKALDAIVSLIGETCILAANDFSVDDKELERIFKESSEQA